MHFLLPAACLSYASREKADLFTAEGVERLRAACEYLENRRGFMCDVVDGLAVPVILTHALRMRSVPLNAAEVQQSLYLQVMGTLSLYKRVNVLEEEVHRVKQQQHLLESKQEGQQEQMSEIRSEQQSLEARVARLELEVRQGGLGRRGSRYVKPVGCSRSCDACVPVPCSEEAEAEAAAAGG